MTFVSAGYVCICAGWCSWCESRLFDANWVHKTTDKAILRHANCCYMGLPHNDVMFDLDQEDTNVRSTGTNDEMSYLRELFVVILFTDFN